MIKYKQKIQIKRTFEKRPNHRKFFVSDEIINKSLIINKNNLPVSEKDLWENGLEKYKRQKFSFGTNFHSIYASDAETYHIFSLAEDKQNVILRKIDSIKKLRKFTSVIDIGCGTGKLGKELSKKFKKIYLLDNNKTLLNKAKKINNSHSKTEFLLSKAECIPLLDNTVDLCVSTWASFSPNEAISEMERVVKSGGYIIKVGICEKDEFTELFPSFNEKNITRHLKYMNKQGFKIEKENITISFKNLSEAKLILSRVLGCSENVVKKSSFKHKVAIQIKKVLK